MEKLKKIRVIFIKLKLLVCYLLGVKRFSKIFNFLRNFSIFFKLVKTALAPPVSLAHLSAPAYLVEPDQVARSNRPGHSPLSPLPSLSPELW
jgi:hypothetical protein